MRGDRQSLTVTLLHLFRPSLEWNRWQNRGSFLTDGIKLPRVNVQGLENGRSYLGCAHCRPHCTRFETRIGQQQNDIGVVVREAAMLRLLMVAARIGDADVWGHDDIGRAGVLFRIVVV